MLVILKKVQEISEKSSDERIELIKSMINDIKRAAREAGMHYLNRFQIEDITFLTREIKRIQLNDMNAFQQGTKFYIEYNYHYKDESTTIVANVEYIGKCGDKIYNLKYVQMLLDCDDDVLKCYRM
jgi:hypothetical protein